MKQYILIIGLALALPGCKTTNTNNTNASPIASMSADGNKEVLALVASDAPPEIYQHMKEAQLLIQKGDLSKALDANIDPIIEYFTQKYQNKYSNMFSARSKQESMLYTMTGLLQSGLTKKNNKPDNIYNIPYVFAFAFYLKGYINISLGRLSAAKNALNQALQLSPNNSLFSSELGHIYQTEKRYIEALEIFEKSVKDADVSPTEIKITEKGRALRGAGYSLIELNRLDEAEVKYNEAIKLNPDDKSSSNELKYISELRNKGSL
ncbi:MAG: tetratricopeptide repeat protein [Alphaproteobacteria bacterium]|nr:tetratricopeptide repeat protein [Alphaproteobacteria bacterium]